ncbi:hypothetical protein niasHT_019016 [Heterodera trifolii]|uniref:Uncharacterized protein n=1 Tax=Heterodera trifolii TaxID=157864 RepID=A0ABD2LEL7_9BILA
MAHHPNILGQMPPIGQIGPLIQPFLVNAGHQQEMNPFCADGTHNQHFLNGCVAEVGQLLPPLCLIVVAVEHRAAQQTAAGPLPVTNCVLRTGDGQRVEASGWQASAHVLASLTIGGAYWFINCVARPRFQRLGCRFRVGVGGPNALVVPHVAPQLTANIPPMVPVQIGGGRDAINVAPPPNMANDGDDGRADLNNNNNDNSGLEPCLRGARPPQRRAAEPVFDESFVIERTTPMRNVPRNTRGEICELRFRPMEEAARPDLLMEALIQHLLDRVLEGHPRPSLVGLQLHPPGFDRPYVIRLRPPEQNNAAALAAAIERLNEQSAAGIDLLAGTTVTKVLAVWPLEAVRADPQRGGACDLDVEHHVSHSVQSFVRVNNPNDRLCLARAVLLGLRDRETRIAAPRLSQLLSSVYQSVYNLAEMTMDIVTPGTTQTATRTRTRTRRTASRRRASTAARSRARRRQGASTNNRRTAPVRGRSNARARVSAAVRRASSRRQGNNGGNATSTRKKRGLAMRRPLKLKPLRGRPKGSRKSSAPRTAGQKRGRGRPRTVKKGRARRGRSAAQQQTTTTADAATNTDATGAATVTTDAATTATTPATTTTADGATVTNANEPGATTATNTEAPAATTPATTTTADGATVTNANEPGATTTTTATADGAVATNTDATGAATATTDAETNTEAPAAATAPTATADGAAATNTDATGAATTPTTNAATNTEVPAATTPATATIADVTLD